MGKKKIGAERIGLLPNHIVKIFFFILQYSFCIAEKKAWRVEIVLQEGQVYCNSGSLAAEETVLQYSLVGSRFVSQYKLYCELGEGLGRDTAWAGAGRCDTALGVATRPGAQQAQVGAEACRRQGRADAGARGERVAGGRQAQAGVAPAVCGRWVGAQARGRALQGRAGRAGRAAWARGLAAGWALGALGLFSIRFDSVLFLSRFLDIVREPGS